MSNATRKTVQRGKVTFSRLFASDYQKSGSKTLEIKQLITTTMYYPTKKFNSDLQDALFSESDFGVEENGYETTETRVAWIPVPANYTEVQVKQIVASLPNEACIYKMLSNSPILTDNQRQAVNQGLKSLDDFANAQAIRYPNNSEFAGELILDAQDRIQYKRTFFSKTAQEDIDERGNGNEYASDELLEEVEGAAVYKNQKV
jgi:hypothetical protein